MNRNSKSFDLAFIPGDPMPMDIDEVTYMQLYYHAPMQPAKVTQEVARQRNAHVSQPLIDIVTPQPKAFYAYLRMPKPEKSATSARVKRQRKGTR